MIILVNFWTDNIQNGHGVLMKFSVTLEHDQKLITPGEVHNEQEHLECLCSEETPTASWLPILLESYWIPSQKKTKSNLQIQRICQNFTFSNFETNFTRDTPSEVAW